ncbi:MAG: ATP-binding protein [Candidatus Avilachnospira sp.]
MRKLSIKTRISLWYTGFMVLLVSMALVIIFLISGRISSKQIEDRLKNVVTDIVTETDFRYGEPDTEGMDFYRDGVSVFIYDTSGRLLAPRINLGVQVDSVLQDRRVRTVSGGVSGDSMVYDVYAVKGDNAFWVRGISSMSEASAAYKILNLLILITFPAFIILSALGGRRITDRAFRPIKEMASTAERISSGDHLSERISVDGSDDELTSLASTLNHMFERLSLSFEKEKQFTSDVSHELRTPLAVIKAGCEYALSGKASEKDKEEALLAIYKQSERMGKMTEQLLMLTRADKGSLNMNIERLDLSRLLRELWDDLVPAAESESLSVRSDIEKDIFVSGDELLLLRLMSNLIMNAIKYNRPGGSVEVSLKREGESCVFAVTDTGIGISEKDLPHIWDRFYRAEKSRSSEGAGLGLSMVKSIAELHKGETGAESKPYEGSRFWVLLPCVS